MSGTFLLYLSYCAVALFVVVLGYRTKKIADMPMHLRWELAPVPHEKGKNKYGGSYFEDFEWWTKKREHTLMGVVTYMFKEIVLLKGVWENFRGLWAYTFAMHNALYLMIAMGALLLATAIASVTNAATETMAAMTGAIKVLAAVAYALGVFGAVGLFFMRLGSEKLKPFTTPVMILNLLILGAMFVSGGYALLSQADFSVAMAGFATAFITADTAVSVSGPVAAHIFFIMLFLVYMPFSFMMHMTIKYFTYHNIRWDDEPMAPGHKMEKEVQGLLGQKVTWAAEHLQTGKPDQNWVDIATKEVS